MDGFRNLELPELKITDFFAQHFTNLQVPHDNNLCPFFPGGEDSTLYLRFNHHLLGWLSTRRSSTQIMFDQLLQTIIQAVDLLEKIEEYFR